MPLKTGNDRRTGANDLLQTAELLAKGKVNGPEEVAVDEQGRIYFGTPAEQYHGSFPTV